MIPWLKSLFKKSAQSVETITSGLTKMVKTLEAHADAKFLEAIAHADAIEKATAAKVAATAEGEKAQAVAKNIGALIAA